MGMLEGATTALSATAWVDGRAGATQGQQRVWGALQRVSSLSAMLAWPAEHLQELQPMLQL